MGTKKLKVSLTIYVENHDKTVKFFEEMGLLVMDQYATESTTESVMALSHESDFSMSIIKEHMVEGAASIHMEIIETGDAKTMLGKSFILNEENYYPRLSASA